MTDTTTDTTCADCGGEGTLEWCRVCTDILYNCDCEMEANGDYPDHYTTRDCDRCDGAGIVEDEAAE